MMKKTAFALACAAAVALAGWAFAYERYNGCVSCHGQFTDATTTKGSIFPGNDKHTMHRASQNMNTDCALCHRQDDGNNPYIGSSDGTGINPSIGCTGCHPTAGLRLHHEANGVDCTSCHDAGTPVAENIAPVYYGTADTNVASPCNATATTGVNENWTVNCCLGSDTDGDTLYDMADPDCSGPVLSPGEAGVGTGALKVTAYNKVTGAVTISYGTPTCSTTDYNIEYGPIANVSTYAYSGQVCNIGTTGTATFTPPVTNTFFLVVARDATKEGSYGKKKAGLTFTERPEDTTSVTCPLVQNLATRCDP